MEIPVLNRIGDFENLHQGPSNYLISQAGLCVSGIARVAQAYSFWKCGALLLLALVAAFSGVANRFRSFVLSFRPLPSETLLHYESDSDADEASDSDSDSEDDDEEAESDSGEKWRRVDEDSRVRGSEQWQSRNKLRLRHRRSIGDGDLSSWPELGSGKSVVEIWRPPPELASFFPAISASPPAVFVSAGASGSRNVELKVWDRRVSCTIPEILAEWRSQAKKTVGFEKLFVGDMRKANAPLEGVTEPEVDAWWDDDGVRVGGEFLDALDGENYKSAMSRCCDAVRSHLLLGGDGNF